MDRRRFLTISTFGDAWFVGLLTLYNKFGPKPVDSRVRVEDYLHLGERAALEAITSNANFYITSKGWTPQIKVDEWRLVIDGLVENPVTLTLPQVKALPREHRASPEMVLGWYGSFEAGRDRMVGHSAARVHYWT